MACRPGLVERAGRLASRPGEGVKGSRVREFEDLVTSDQRGFHTEAQRHRGKELHTSTESSLSSGWQLSWRKRAEVAAISGLGYPLIAALGHTLRWRISGWEHLEAIWSSGRQPVMAFWHGRILPATFYFRNRGIVVITSENFDGEWIARIIERFGYGTSRGSTSRGAKRAMLQLVRDMRRGKPAGFTVDGPRGPARVVQPGAVWLAKVTGKPIIPFHLEGDRHWTMRSWDRTQIPQPFATVALAFAPPIVVSRDATDEGMAQTGHDLESSLADCERQCHALLAAPRGT